MMLAVCCVLCWFTLGLGATGLGTRSMETLDWPSIRTGNGVPALAPPLGVPALGVCPLDVGPLVLGVAGLICRTPGALGWSAAPMPGLNIGNLVAGEEGLVAVVVIAGLVILG